MVLNVSTRASSLTRRGLHSNNDEGETPSSNSECPCCNGFYSKRFYSNVVGGGTLNLDHYVFPPLKESDSNGNSDHLEENDPNDDQTSEIHFTFDFSNLPEDDDVIPSCCGSSEMSKSFTASTNDSVLPPDCEKPSLSSDASNHSIDCKTLSSILPSSDNNSTTPNALPFTKPNPSFIPSLPRVSRSIFKLLLVASMLIAFNLLFQNILLSLSITSFSLLTIGFSEYSTRRFCNLEKANALLMESIAHRDAQITFICHEFRTACMASLGSIELIKDSFEKRTHKC
ncbi:hypothetical protein FDP41_000302 [Naegleria fowleri]|uniref:Uncharacterized protein n=1 Tax=Naegleria fowleri TaxID=5763 RepID=A0A6A5C1W1_NAEFO|nr:uncharacterized protein FDP41_000302 [Naegleria fowleri]KAF0984403.1 hypothetical protein FDP41_000302 [Naegleria fowleri]CAG4717901.1 unnamed protein product [Naegleria fowleri]